MTTRRLAHTLPGGNNGLPFLGNTVDIFRDPRLFYWEQFQRYGSHFKNTILGRSFAILVGPDANQFVLKDHADCFSSRLGWEILEPFLQGGVLLQDGAEHLSTRKLMYPAFHQKAIQHYVEQVQGLVNEWVLQWRSHHDVLLLKDLRQLTLQIAFRLLLSIQTKSEIDHLSQLFSQFIQGQLTVVRLDVPWTKFGQALSARQQLEDFVQRQIDHRRTQPSLSKPDVLQLLMDAIDEEGNRLSDRQISTQIVQLLFGGHETTAQQLCWCLRELFMNPEWRIRVREEIQAVVGNAPLTTAHLRQLPQLDCVLKEVERLYPPVYVIPRGVIREFEFAGYTIPIGWTVGVSPLLTHRSPQIYRSPHQFDPDRFAPPREEHKQHPFALIGFGGGAHACLGLEIAQMEMKVVLVTLLRYLTWRVTPAQNQSQIMPPHNQEASFEAHFVARQTVSPVSEEL